MINIVKKQKVLWCFLVGIIVGIYIGVIIVNYKRHKIINRVNVLSYYPEYVKSILQENNVTDWLNDVKIEKTEHYIMMTPYNNKSGYCTIHCISNVYPVVMFIDEDSNGVPEKIFIEGKKLKTNIDITLNNAGNIIGLGMIKDICCYSNMISWFDKDIDGQWDVIMGPEDKIKERIGGKMYDVIADNGFWAKTENGLRKIIKDKHGNRILDKGTNVLLCTGLKKSGNDK